MASFIYNLALQGFASGSFDLATANIKVALVQISGSGSPYTANQASDQYLSALPGVTSTTSPSGCIASIAGNLTGVSVTNGIFGAANITFASVTFSQPVGAMVMYIDTGTVATSPLIAYMDSANYSGLPFTPSGASVPVSWPTGTNKIFSL
jgi:hypothetical protein